MSNDYKHVGMPLRKLIARELIIEEFSGKVAERQEIIDTIVKIHRDRGGSPPLGQAAGVFKKALADMKQKEKQKILPKESGESAQVPIRLKQRLSKASNHLRYPIRKKSSKTTNPIRPMKRPWDRGKVRFISTITPLIGSWQN